MRTMNDSHSSKITKKNQNDRSFSISTELTCTIYVFRLPFVRILGFLFEAVRFLTRLFSTVFSIHHDHAITIREERLLTPKVTKAAP